MYTAKRIFVFFLSLLFFLPLSAQQTDVLIIGGGASGISAGLSAARLGVKTTLLEESSWLGGMLTSAGVSAIDGNYKLPAGFWGEFRDSIASYYGGLENLKTGWVSHVLYEPSVGNKILKQLAAQTAGLDVLYQAKPTTIVKEGSRWRVQYELAGQMHEIQAQILIDATELGDVAKACGVPYDIGMESRAETHEDIAPEYSNGIVQDLTYVAILKDYGKDVRMSQPKNYDPSLFACCCINPRCVQPKEPDRMWSKEKLISYGQLPNNKYMINWPIEGNDYYLNLIELSAQERLEALKAAKEHTLNFIYFIQHELGFTTLGLADDEFPTADLLPWIPYHRESRRIHGLVRFTLNHISAPYEQEQALYRTSIAVGDYPVDHHHTRYQGYEELPNLYFHPVPSYGLPLATLLPQQVENLIVAEKSISVSNLVNGTTRLQPVVLQIGQAAGTLAALAIKQDKKVSELAVREVQEVLLQTGAYLMPLLDVDKNDKLFLPLQRIAVSGLLQAEGKTVEWSNEMWMRIEDALLLGELEGLVEYYPYLALPTSTQAQEPVCTAQLLSWINQIAKEENYPINTSLSQVNSLLSDYGLAPTTATAQLSRGQAVVLLDRLVDPFHRVAVGMQGELLK